VTETDRLAKQAKIIRHLVLDMIYRAKSAHLGCALSIVDILAALYLGDILKIDPTYPGWENRDKFILSKGHACVALYATLAMKGFFPIDILGEYGTDGTSIGDHNTLGSLPGIETTNGSLGHGLPIGIGMALAAKKAHRSSRVFVLVGDGELQEGSNWEALMFAGFHKLNNLVLIVDNNNLETVGNTSKILSLEPLDKKIESFGWVVKTIDGHSFRQMTRDLSFNFRPYEEKPFAVIANTTKSKGIPFMEGDYIWHGKIPSPQEYERAKKELGEVV